MHSATISRLLGRLRRRERLLGFSLSAAHSLAVVFALLVLACLVDWLIDLRRDTPWELRVGLLAVQTVVWLIALVFAVRPLFRRIHEDEMALRVEQNVPELGHRLISAVQLNRPGAKTQGMSPELIDAVTVQADKQAATISPGQIIKADRLGRAAMVVAPLALAVVLLLVLLPATSAALLARVFLADRAIPRSIELQPGDQVWASGEEGTLEVEVTGDVSSSAVGEVLIEPEEGQPIRLSLQHDRDTPDGSVFVAKVPAGDVPFRYLAWLADARLRSPGQVRYSPRPVVQELTAWVDLPVDKLGKQPSGKPYAELQRGGDIVFRLDGSQARLDITAQVPVAEVRVSIEGKKPREEVIRLVPAHEKVSVSFALQPDDTGYTVGLRNADGFDSKDRARRSIRRLPLEPPVVMLLPETFWREGDSGTPEDREVEGIPVLLGERCRLEYRGTDRYGLSHALLRYRLIKRSKDGDAGEPSPPMDLDSFLPLPLGPGRKAKKPISAKAREEFSTRADSYPGALPDSEGHGRYDFSSQGIPDGKGGLLKLEEGDRIQFYVEMYSKADADGVPGRSAIREKEIMKLPAYLSWLKKKDDLGERTRVLEEQQRTARPGGLD